jgi:hypothetical protein
VFIVFRVAHGLRGRAIWELSVFGPLRQVLDGCRGVPVAHHIEEELLGSKGVGRRGAQREGTVRRHACGQAPGLSSDRGSLLFRQRREQRERAIEQAFCLDLVGFRQNARDPQQCRRADGWLRLFRLQHRREQFSMHGEL